MTWRLGEAGLRDFGAAVALTSVPAEPADGARRSVPYRTFAGRAAAVAEQLDAMGVRPGDPVALLSRSRGADEAVAFAGILLSGAAAVPLDAMAPAPRWQQILAAAGCRAIVHDEDARGAVREVARVGGEELGRVELDGEGFVLAGIGNAADVPNPHADRADLACVLHTSGSTGVPLSLIHI